MWKFMDITLQQLRVFVAAARHRSYTKTAEELLLTQPSVSTQIKQLTKTVGQPLFEQIGSKLYLTQTGQELLATSKSIFLKLEGFERGIADMLGMQRGLLRLNAVTTAQYVIPRLLGPFCQQYPGVDIALNFGSGQHLLNPTHANGQADLYILSQPPTNPEVEYYPFLDNPLIVLGSPKNILAQQRKIPLSRLMEEPFILREAESSTRQVTQRFFEQHGLQPKVRLELGSSEAIKQAIVGGMGVSVLSQHVLTLTGVNSQLTVLDVDGFPIPNQWYVAFATNNRLSIVARTFLDYLLDEGKTIAERQSYAQLSCPLAA
jgi:LysR family transcriptional regulator, low CO2-responsive transcriptional regulator